MQQNLKRARFLFLSLLAASCMICSVWAAGQAALAVPSDGVARHAMALFGEPKYKANFPHFDYANPDAQKGGTIRYAEIGTFDSLNPYLLKGMAAAGVSMLFETLMQSSEDEPFSQYGLIAESVSVSKDKRSVTFHLRPEARWQDGKAITADDVVFSFETLTTKGHPFYRSYYQDVDSVKKINEREVTFHLKSTENRELPLTVGQLPILPKHYYENPAHPFDKTTLEPPLGSGPYRVKELQVGHFIVYERVTDYWGKDLAINKGRYNMDFIRYDYFRDATVAIEAFKADEYDIRLENISKVWATAYDDMTALKEGRVKKEELRHHIPTGMQGFVMNTRRKPFSDVRVRQAISEVFDFEWTNKQLFYDAYTRTTSFFSNSIFAASGLPDQAELALLNSYRDQLPEEVYTTEMLPPVTDGSGNNRAQLRDADRLLNEAGWVVKSLKRVNAETGEPLQIEFLLDSPSFERVIAPMIKRLERLGIAAKIRTVDSAQYQKRLDTFDFDVIVNVFGQSNAPGNEQLEYWHSSKANEPGSKNFAGIQDPVVDAMVAKVISATTKEQLVTATRALDRVLRAGYYVIPNWHIRAFRLIYWDRFERPKMQPDYALGLDYWWVKP